MILRLPFIVELNLYQWHWGIRWSRIEEHVQMIINVISDGDGVGHVPCIEQPIQKIRLEEALPQDQWSSNDSEYLFRCDFDFFQITFGNDLHIGSNGLFELIDEMFGLSVRMCFAREQLIDRPTEPIDVRNQVRFSVAGRM